MMQVNVLHQEAMNLAELAQVAKLRGEIEQSNHLLSLYSRVKRRRPNC
jgi:hypothetical protein